MREVLCRIEGRAGRITLNRPNALNALTHSMVLDIERALEAWAADDAVALLLIDGAGDKAFCAGGDIAELYRSGRAGDFFYGRRFWADEYRMNARLARFPKPVVSFLHGYVMGGGVGVGCHGSHRIVGDSSRVAMPECGIGLVPDVGGSLLLAQAPGRLGEYLGTTGQRMRVGGAILAGFADYYLPEPRWEALKAELAGSGDVAAVDAAAQRPPPAQLGEDRAWIDAHFDGETLGDILRSLRAVEDPRGRRTLVAMGRNAPLSMACTVEMVHRLRGPAATIERALELEYRFTARSMEHGDFLEGIRAAIIDKDQTPTWRHKLDEVTPAQVSAMLRPLDGEALKLEETA